MMAQACDNSGMELYDFIPAHTDKLEEPTFLYAPEPIGIGTPFVESLASYFIRLSAAHMLPPSAMLREVIAPYLPSKLSRNFGNTIGRQSIVAGMNGIGEEAEVMVEILERLTGRTNLEQLTMLPFSGMLAKYKLQSQESSWCPYCFKLQRTSGHPVHYHLFWGLRVTNRCPIHRCRLWKGCPHCKSTLPVVGSRSIAGYCNKCNGWLGCNQNKLRASSVDEGDFFVRLFRWQNAIGHKRQQPTFPAMLEYLIGKHMKKKNVTSIGRLLHLPEPIVEELLANRMLPVLGVIFWIGHVFKIDPFDILTKDGEEMAAKDLLESAKVGQIMFDMNRINWKQLEGLLGDVASGKASAMRVDDIARVYRCPTSELTRRYAELCCQITERFGRMNC